MLTVHHLNSSRSHRILWMLEELQIPYEVKKYQRTEQRKAPKELLVIHPLGLSPVITDGDLTLAESGTIVAHSRKYGPHMRPYMKRMHDRPAYQRALKKVGEYGYANPEL